MLKKKREREKRGNTTRDTVHKSTTDTHTCLHCLTYKVQSGLATELNSEGFYLRFGRG